MFDVLKSGIHIRIHHRNLDRQQQYIVILHTGQSALSNLPYVMGESSFSRLNFACHRCYLDAINLCVTSRHDLDLWDLKVRGTREMTRRRFITLIVMGM